jgi:hypothetical protein
MPSSPPQIPAEAHRLGEVAINDLYERQGGSADNSDLARVAVEAAYPHLLAVFRERLKPRRERHDKSCSIYASTSLRCSCGLQVESDLVEEIAASLDADEGMG